jgi:hypothetical protein
VPRTSATGFLLWVGTPTASDSKTVRSERFRKGRMPTPAEAASVPTPTANDAKNSTLPPSQRRRDSLIGYLLASGTVPTPKASDAERGGRGDLLQIVRGKESPSHRWRTPTVTDAVHSGRKKPSKPGKQISLPQQVNDGADTTGQLNPEWVEWLMGFPTGWTDCGGSATPSCPKSPSGSGDA